MDIQQLFIWYNNIHYIVQYQPIKKKSFENTIYC